MRQETAWLEPVFRELVSLNKTQRLAFAASTCERMLPVYSAFTLMEGWGDYLALRKALQEVWRIIRDEDWSSTTVSCLLPACTANLPDPERFSSIFANGAQSCCSALLITLEAIGSSSASGVSAVAELADDTIWEYLYTVNDPQPLKFEEDKQFLRYLETHPMRTLERQKQLEDLQYIRSSASITDMVIRTLRKEAHKYGIQPFYRGLVISSRPRTRS